MWWKEANTREKKYGLFTFSRQSWAPAHLLSQLGQLQAVWLAGGEKINLLRYLDSILDRNKETSSQKVYAKIFIISYLVFHIPQILT